MLEFALFILFLQSAARISFCTQPNVVFILADDIGYNNVPWNNGEAEMPHLNALATNGTIFDNYYAQTKCTPSRSALLTGLYPIHTGRQAGVITGNSRVGLLTNFTLLPERLKQLGYRTHLVGKWNLGHCNVSYLPTRRGFDTFYGFYGSHQTYFTHNDMERDNAYDFRDQDRIAWEANGTHSTHLFRDRANELLRQHKANYPGSPFFLFLSFPNVHTPLELPSGYRRYCRLSEDTDEEEDHLKFRRKLCRLAKMMDDAVGSFVQELKNTGLNNNTIIIFSSDNGGNDGYGNNNPLRGSKHTIWEGGYRVPAFIHIPFSSRRGVVSHQLFHITDWFPTIESAAKADLPEQQLQNYTDFIGDGIDQWKSILEGTPGNRSEIWYNMNPSTGEAAIRIRDLKLIRVASGLVRNLCRQKARRLVCRNRNLEAETFLLFNISSDPNETTDIFPTLSGTNTSFISELQNRLSNLESTMIPLHVSNHARNQGRAIVNGTITNNFCNSEPR